VSGALLLLAGLLAPDATVPLPPVPHSPATWDLPTSEDPLRYVGVFFARGTVTDLKPTSALLDGQVTGRLFGPNGVTTDDDAHTYIEQRYLGFFDYSPTLLDGRATLRGAFEIDFTYGDLSNSTRPNAGGAINGDVVNLQTKRLAADVALTDDLRLVVGLQPLADSARDPARALPDDLLHAGGHLMFWGTDAAGVSLFGSWQRRAFARLSYFDLYLNQSDRDDDVELLMFDGALTVAASTEVGLHAWYLRDRGRGLGSPLGAGPASKLAAYNGTTPLSLGPDRADADLYWLGVDASHNRWLAGGPLSLSGLLMLNLGTFDVIEGSNRSADAPPFDDTDADLFAFLVNLEAAWRWGRASGDVLSLELLYASGDDTPDDRTVSSVVTGNAYGVPGALHATHRSLLLFPDSRVVNRQVAVVYDPGNLGYGVTAAFLNGSVDVIDETLTLKLGYALAAAAAQPVGGDRFIGQELNGEVLYRPMPFLWFGAHAAVVRLGTFLEGRVNDDPLPDGRPWVGYLTMTWVHF
jgi:hypothetical protein